MVFVWALQAIPPRRRGLCARMGVLEDLRGRPETDGLDAAMRSSATVYRGRTPPGRVVRERPELSMMRRLAQKKTSFVQSICESVRCGRLEQPRCGRRILGRLRLRVEHENTHISRQLRGVFAI